MCVVPMTGSPPMPTHVEKPTSRSSYIIWYVSVPDLDTRPTRPGVVMSAGMMPALDLPGEAIPGQFGPMMRVPVVPEDGVPLATACAQNHVESCTGMPSVMTTHSGISASMASTTASLVNLGGTKTTETSAPVSAMASATVPNTGRSLPSYVAICPALRALTPPTTLVPARSMRAVCLEPSEPVIPCTMTLLLSVSQIAISHP